MNTMFGGVFAENNNNNKTLGQHQLKIDVKHTLEFCLDI